MAELQSKRSTTGTQNVTGESLSKLWPPSPYQFHNDRLCHQHYETVSPGQFRKDRYEQCNQQ